MRQLIFAATLLATGCSSTPRTVLVDGREVPRPTLEFGGQPFSIQHTRAYPNPGSPSSGLTDAGGDIHGRVCGISVDYTVAHEGDHVQLKGRVDGPLSSEIAIREDGNSRTFEGRLSKTQVTLVLRDDALEGRVGRRQITLTPSGNQLLGYEQADGGQGGRAVVVHGLQALRDMPAADQGAVLPALLACGASVSQDNTLVIGFGGKTTDVY